MRIQNGMLIIDLDEFFPGPPGSIVTLDLPRPLWGSDTAYREIFIGKSRESRARFKDFRWIKLIANERIIVEAAPLDLRRWNRLDGPKIKNFIYIRFPVAGVVSIRIEVERG